MEKSSVTIEIKQEVSIALLWTVGGVIAIAVPFFICLKPLDLWPSVNAGGLTAAFYVLALIIYATRGPVKRKTRVLVLALFGVVVSSLAYSWKLQESQSNWQREMLVEIRGVLGRGISSAVLGDTLLNTLQQFYSQSPQGRHSLGQVFKLRYPDAAVGMDLYKPQWPGDTLTHAYVGALTDDRVVLIGRDRVAKGRDPSFRNFEGAVGKIQERYTLTEKGLIRESDN